MYAGLLAGLLLCGCHQKKGADVHEPEHAKAHEHDDDDKHEHEHEEAESQLIVTMPLKRDTIVAREYVCQIHSCRNIELRAVERGYLQSVFVKEGQLVKEGDPMFKILPLVYQAELTSAEAEAQISKVEYENTKRLTESKVVSDKELAISKAKWEQKVAVVNLAQAHLGFTNINAPFSGLMDRLRLRNGSLVDEGDLLTTLSDNSEMWVYFNVPEAEYLDYMSEVQPEERKKVDLLMANGKIFNQPGRVNVIEAEFNSQTGTIPFRADFANPDRLLRHGETGNIRMNKMVKGALLVPQKATFEILDHHYVFIVGKDDILTQQRIHISEELEDVFIVSEGLTDKDKIVLEGMRQAKSGAKAVYVFKKPEEAFKDMKLHAE
ncbi:efflux RND transporter periplasmic adaptor subunit [Prosthecobacter sp.]|uniref:efflux RND transporter periplasmic adaptor subunit n=1 Tax=Prosthecobacter sp. TaxID=1965333 RepID=UPI00248A31FB|nr:efflux RND transporter periplasmic adaptor subunit [Prosthecobacter sp.]MDI1312885.1 efflux RND transporter periplasmic adaptor subunit [Prosthecobacter sp.]